MLPGVRSPRPIVGRNVRALQMKTGQRTGKRRLFARFRQGREAVLQRFERIGNERRTKSADTMCAANANHMANVIGAKLRRVEADAVAAIDLQIEQRRRDPAGFAVGYSGRRTKSGNAAILADDVYELP